MQHLTSRRTTLAARTLVAGGGACHTAAAAPLRCPNRVARLRASRDSIAMVAAPDDGRVLFIGGLPPSSLAADITARLKALCPAATHVALRHPHRGFALLPFRCAEAAGEAAEVLRAAAPREPLFGPLFTVAPAEKIPASWPPEWTMTEGELAAAAKQRERAERHHAHLKRRRQRQKDQMLTQLDGLLHGLASDLPGGLPIWSQYSPLLEGLAAEWAAAAGAVDGTGHAAELGKDAAACAAATAAVLAGAPPRLRAALCTQQFERALSSTAAGREAAQGPIMLDAAPCIDRTGADLMFDWSKLPPEVDPAIGGKLADADTVRMGDSGGRMNMRALRKRVQVEGFALALLQLLPGLRRRRERAGHAAQQHSTSEPVPLTVVDFGSGSGNLTLPLAWLFEEAGCAFVAVDLKPAAIKMLLARAAAAGLTNVTAINGAIEDYSGPADSVVALHACGAASDAAMQQAVVRGAAFLVSPCCIGKVNLAAGAFGAEAARGSINPQQQKQQHKATDCRDCSEYGAELPHGRLPPLQRPRSQQLGEAIARHLAATSRNSGSSHPDGAAADGPIGSSGDEDGSESGSDRDSGGEGDCKAERRAEAEGSVLTAFEVLARVADYSHTEDHGYPELAAAAKAYVELDRSLAAGEAGYEWRLARLPQPGLTAKNDVIVGWPAADGGG